VMYGIDHVTNSRVDQGVKNAGAFPAGVHNTALPEHRQVAGDGRLRNRQYTRQIADGLLPLA